MTNVDYDQPLQTLEGEPAALSDFKGKALLIVNVASKCGFTPQYEGLQKLYDAYKDRGFEILGFPCNQFLEQEPGSADEIRSFCSTTYGVSFPLFAKIDVNGENRHPLYETLTQTPDHKGETGDVKWNFEKYLVAPDGEVVGRFSTKVVPEHPALIEAIERHLSS